MKIAVGIIAIFFSLIALLQSCALTGLSNIAEDEATAEAGLMGTLVALFMFFGGAFSFALPTVARVMFLIGFAMSWLGNREDFPDLVVWGWVSLILAALISFFIRSEGKQQSGKPE